MPARSQDLTQAPELHLAGPALTPSLLVMDPSALSSDGLLFGRLFESLATLTVRIFAQKNAEQ